MSEPRRAQGRKQWMPNRMFDAEANAFAVQNLLSKDQEGFSPESERRKARSFVVDKLGQEDEAPVSHGFVVEGSETSAQTFAADGAQPVASGASSSVSAAASSTVSGVSGISDVAEDVASEVAADMPTEQAPEPQTVVAEAMAESPHAATDNQEQAANPMAEATSEPTTPALPEAVTTQHNEPSPVSEAQAEIVVPPPIETAAPVEAPMAGLSVVAITNMVNAAREEAHNAAYKDGFFAGQAKARAELQEEYDKKFAALKSLSDGLQELSNDAEALFEPLKKLAIHLAEQLVRGELAQSGQAISRLVENALQEMGGSGEKTMIVHLNTEDLEQFRPLAEQFGTSITLRPNSTLKRGSVRVSLDGSIVEDLIERRIEGMSKSLAQPTNGSWRNGQSTSLAARIDAAKRAGQQVVQDVAPIEVVDAMQDAGGDHPGQDHA